MNHRHFEIRDGRYHCLRCPWHDTGRTRGETVEQMQRHAYPAQEAT